MTTTNTAKQLANRVARLEGALNHPMAGETALAAVLRETIQRLEALERHEAGRIWKEKHVAAEPVVRVMPRDELIAYVKLHYTKHTRLYILQQLLGDLT